MNPVSSRIKKLYDPALYRRLAAQIADEVHHYFTRAQTAPYPGLPWRPPHELLEIAEKSLETPRFQGKNPSVEEMAEAFHEHAKTILNHSNRLHSPHYMGHQVSPSIPVTALFDGLGALINQGGAVYEMGPITMAAERAMVKKLGSYLGWPDGWDGILTHGGSLANLTAILAARNARYKDAWSKGMGHTPQGQPALMTSQESHYSLARAAGVAGIGTDHVLSIPIVADRSMDVSKLESMLGEARTRGLDVFCIVGSACTTPTGAFDDLEAIGAFAKKHNIWFHVDAAHGGGLLLSPEWRSRLKGIETADSVTWDAHKMMFVPSLSTYLFYQRREESFSTFHQNASYLFDQRSAEELEFDSALRTVECTKRALAIGVWALWSAMGPDVFADLVDRTCIVTGEFYSLLETSSDFEPSHAPQCNILCFRFLPDVLKKEASQRISEVQSEIRKKLVQGGQFYITGTVLDGESHMRVTIMNPLTDDRHLKALMDEIREIGYGLLR